MKNTEPDQRSSLPHRIIQGLRRRCLCSLGVLFIASSPTSSNALTIILDFNDPIDLPAIDVIGNTVENWNPVDYGHVEADREMIKSWILALVKSHYYDIVTTGVNGASPLADGFQLDVDFEIGSVGTAPVNGDSEYYYVQIGDYVSGPGNGFGQARTSGIRDSGGSGPGFGLSQAGTVGSVYPDHISGIIATDGPIPTGGNLLHTINLIGGTTSHEIGHGVSLSHLNAVGAVNPNGLPTLMGTGAIDLPNGDRFFYREFSLSGVDGENGNAPQNHIQQLVNALGTRAITASAGLQFWDGGNTGAGIQGGSGVWNNANTNWTNPAGSVNTGWTGEFAVFAGTPGMVTLGDNISFKGLNFATGSGATSYEVAGAGVFTLSPNGAASIISEEDVEALISAPISGGGDLIKTGRGVLILSGDNSYTGETTVNNGVLLVNGNQLAATGQVTVNDGATLGGSGTIGGAVTINSGGTLAAGNSPGSLTVGPLLLTSGSITDFEFGAVNSPGNPLNDVVHVNGNLTLDGTLNVFTSSGGSFGAGVYRMFNYTGSLTNNEFTFGTAPVATSELYVQYSVPNQINLVNKLGLILNFWDGNNPNNYNNGIIDGGTGTWILNAPNDNWTNAAATANVPYENGQFSIFSGNAGTVTVDDTNGAISISGMQFMTDGYVIQGDVLNATGATTILRVGDGTVAGQGFTATINSVIAGNTTIEKTDLGILVLNGANSYTGGTRILNGTVEVSSNSNLGNVLGSILFDANATLRYRAGFDHGRGITLDSGGGRIDTNGFNAGLSGIIQGTGALTKLGLGVLSLSGVNTYTGDTHVDDGILALAGGGSLIANAQINIADPATLEFRDSTSAQVANIDNSGVVRFLNTSQAATSIISNYGEVRFEDQSAMQGASVSNELGSELIFQEQATGSISSKVTGVTGSRMDMSGLSVASLTIGSIQGGGDIFLGSRELIVGGGNLEDLISGIIQDGGDAGGVGGKLTKEGTAGLSLSGANTYTGETKVQSGRLALVGTGSLHENAIVRVAAPGQFEFYDDTSAREFLIDNLGIVNFLNTSGAASSTIENKNQLTFDDQSAVESATITNHLGSKLVFIHQATGSNASSVVNLAGSRMDLSALTLPSLTIGRVEGAGDIYLGSRELIVGGQNVDGLISGIIQDGGDLGGTGGLLTKVGTGVLSLSGANTYTGVTKVLDGTLALVSTGSLILDAQINIADPATLEFRDSTSARQAAIINLGRVRFLNTSHADASTITNGNLVNFEDQSAMESATITNLLGGDLVFLDQATGSHASTVFNNAGSRIDISGLSVASLTIGQVQGEGEIFLGSRELIVGGQNVDAIISGIIQDDGYSGGVGGRLTKEGVNSLLLNAKNVYSGGTNLNQGVLMTDHVSALGTGLLTLNGGQLYPLSKLRVDEVLWNDGVIRLPIGQPTRLAVVHDFNNGGGTRSFLFDYNYTPLLQENTLLTFGGTTNFLAENFVGSGLPEIPNVILEHEFRVTPHSIQLYFTKATAWGPTLQNSAPVLIPTFADFKVEGEVTTGRVNENNIIRSLEFADLSSLQVYQNLVVTSGDFTVNHGIASINGSNVVIPEIFTKLGDGTLSTTATIAVNQLAQVKEGALRVNGIFQAPEVQVFHGALLGGNGTVVGNVSNDGYLAPGNSPGTLSIVGNYDQSSDGAFELEVVSLNVFDILRVSQRASLDGLLDVQYSGSTFEYGDQIAFLFADRIVGTFDSIQVPDSSNFRGRFVNYGKTGVLLIAPASYTQVATTPNQRRVAKALNEWIGEEGGDIGTVTLALDLLGENEYPRAFEAIMPSLYEAAISTGVELSHNHLQLLHQQLSGRRLGQRSLGGGYQNEAPAPATDGKSVKSVKNVEPVVAEAPDLYRWNVWIQGSGLFSSGGLSLAPSEDFESGTIMVGADYALSEHFAVGFYASYQEGWGDYANEASIDMNAVRFGIYATIDYGGFYANAAIGAGSNSYDIKRRINWATLDRTADGEPDGMEYFALFGTGYDFLIGNWTLGPQISAQYTKVELDGFTERGAGSLSLRLDDIEAESLRSYVGGRIAYTWKVRENVAVIPELRVFWKHEFLEGSENLRANLDLGRGPGFDFETSSPERDAVYAGAGVGFQIGPRFYGNVYYNADFSNDDVNHTVSISGSWKF